MKNKSLCFLMVILALILMVGLYHLFALRFLRGDFYPEYSSFRADALGTKALHDSLIELMPVERNLSPISSIQNKSRPTVFLLGVPRSKSWSSSEMTEFKTLATNGARLIVAFLPYDAKPKAVAKPVVKPVKADDPKPVHKKTSVAREENPEEDHWINWSDFWKIEIGTSEKVMLSASSATLGENMVLHTASYFIPPDASWQVLYASGTHAEIIEKSMGKGSLVWVADSYLFSNEALSKNRRPRLIASLVGDSEFVIFDETHFGIEEEPGVALLIRRYHLTGVVLALLIVGALFVWAKSVSFIPAEQTEAEQAQIIVGRDAGEGFVGLLKRSIPPRELLGVCIAEWKRAFGHRTDPALLSTIKVDDINCGPVENYNTLSKIINQKKHGYKK